MKKKLIGPSSILLFTVTFFAHYCFSQALQFNKTLIKVNEASTPQKIKIIASSVQKVNPLEVRIIDVGEGSATEGIDYSLQTIPNNTFILNAANAFTQVIIVNILSDNDDTEDTEDIKLHFQFKNINTNTFSDSLITIQIFDDAKAKKEESNHKFFGMNGMIDTTNHNKTEFCQYTDFLGFGNDKPNGILQQEFLWKWSIVKREFRMGKNIFFQPLRSVLLPSILFNRIEKGKDSGSLFYPVGYTIRSITDDASGKKDTSLSPVISTFDLMRYSSLKLETKVILFAIRIKNTRIYVDFQASLIRNQITDTIIKKNSSRSVYSSATGFSIYLKSPVLVNSDSSFNIEAQFGGNRISLLDNFFKQYDVYALDNEGRKTVAFPIGEEYNRTSNSIYFATIKLSKDWGKESKNSLFLRFTYNYQKGTYNYYTKENPRVFPQTFYNHYLQIHLGINLAIDGLFHN